MEDRISYPPPPRHPYICYLWLLLYTKNCIFIPYRTYSRELFSATTKGFLLFFFFPPSLPEYSFYPYNGLYRRCVMDISDTKWWLWRWCCVRRSLTVVNFSYTDAMCSTSPPPRRTGARALFWLGGRVHGWLLSNTTESSIMTRACFFFFRSKLK